MKDRQKDHVPQLPVIGVSQVESREWWLWALAVIVTLLLTIGMVSLILPYSNTWKDQIYAPTLEIWVSGLAALVLLFDIYTGHQHLQLHRMRRRLSERETLFHLIADNAADMIAVVDDRGRRIYNSPAYEKILGYNPEELAGTSSLEQVHPEDRIRVLQSAEKARMTGHGDRLEYRIRHKNGSWRLLESTASAIPGPDGGWAGLVIVNRDITERKHAEALLQHRALHDSLTNLPNRALFLDRLQGAISIARRHNDFKFAVLFIDVDNFQVFNDSLGHAAGDELILQIARRLTACFRHSDTVSRLGSSAAQFRLTDTALARPGGDEFTVLAGDLRDSSDAVRMARRILEQLADPFALNGRQIVITASIGIVFAGISYADAEDVLRDAEIAMHRAKRSGSGQHEIFDKDMQAGAVMRLQLESDLRRALQQQEFRIYYQPIVSLAHEQVIGFEALARWQRPEGIVGPSEFIEVAEEIGLIVPMNRILFRQACQQLQEWQASLAPSSPLFLSFNVTGKEFAQPDFAAQIRSVVGETGIHPSCVQLEITENVAMEDADRSARVISDLKSVGVKLSIDDFGTGLSSLSRLRCFSVDTLKIDRSFTHALENGGESEEIIRVIVSLAHSLGLQVVAEGIETLDQYNTLKQIGCEMGQGFLFSKAVDALAIEHLLAPGAKTLAASTCG